MHVFLLIDEMLMNFAILFVLQKTFSSRLVSSQFSHQIVTFDSSTSRLRHEKKEQTILSGSSSTKTLVDDTVAEYKSRT